MEYAVEGVVSEISLAPDSMMGKLLFKINPSETCSRESTATGVCKREILMISKSREAKIVDVDSSFAIETKDIGVFIQVLLELKTSKTKVRIVCDGDCRVSVLTAI